MAGQGKSEADRGGRLGKMDVPWCLASVRDMLFR